MLQLIIVIKVWGHNLRKLGLWILKTTKENVKPEEAFFIDVDFTTIKKLLAKAETKLSTEATKTQREKLLRIQEILRDL